MGLTIDEAVCPMRPSFSIKNPFCDRVKDQKNKQYGSSTQMPYWQSLFFYLLGTQFLGKFLGERNIWHEAEFALPKGYSGGAHQEGSCESGILSFPSFHTYHIKIKALLVSGSLVVNHAHWLQLLCPPCPWQWQAAMTSTPGDLYRSLTATSAQLRLRSPGWVWRRSQWRRCQGCYYPKLKSSKRCPKLTETDCFEQIQGWR